MADKLTAKEKIDIITKYVEGMSINEIAKRKGRSTSTIDLLIQDFKKGMAPIDNPEAGILSDELIDIAKIKKEQNLTYQEIYSAVVVGLTIKNKNVEAIEKIATFTESLPNAEVPLFLKTAEQLYKMAEEKGISIDKIEEDVRELQISYNNLIEEKSKLQTEFQKQSTEKQALDDEVLKNKKDLDFAKEIKEILKYYDEPKMLELLQSLSKNDKDAILATSNLLQNAGLSLDRFANLSTTFISLEELGFTDAALKKLKDSVAKENINADQFFQNIKQYIQNRDALRKDLVALNNEKAAKQTEIKTENKKLATIKASIVKKNQELGDLEAKHQEREKINSALQLQTVQLISESKKTENEINKAISALNKQVSNLDLQKKNRESDNKPAN